MYTFNKKDGLEIKSNIHSEEGVQIDVMSDLHLDFHVDLNNERYKENIKSFIGESLEGVTTDNELLIVAGDISHKNEVSREFLSQLSKIWDYVLVIPGNHDWYLQNRSEDRYTSLILTLKDVDNIIFLMDNVEIFEYKGVRIGGTSMIYNLNSMHDYVMWKSIMNDHRFMSREFVQMRNEKDVKYYNKVIDEVDIFVSHVPIVNLDGKATTENLFLNVDVTPVNDVLYISGHTHRPKSSVDKDSDFEAINIGYGYPWELEQGNHKAITTIFFKK